MKLSGQRMSEAAQNPCSSESEKDGHKEFIVRQQYLFSRLLFEWADVASTRREIGFKSERMKECVGKKRQPPQQEKTKKQDAPHDLVSCHIRRRINLTEASVLSTLIRLCEQTAAT